MLGSHPSFLGGRNGVSEGAVSLELVASVQINTDLWPGANWAAVYMPDLQTEGQLLFSLLFSYQHTSWFALFFASLLRKASSY